MFIVPRIAPAAADKLAARLATLPQHRVACCNWPADYPYAPQVSFALLHDGPTLGLLFTVEEQCVRACETVDGRRTCDDSCVEFFLRPDGSPYYYNFEFNAIGTLFLACRTGRHDPVAAPDEVLRSVVRRSSLGTAPFDERTGRCRWQLFAAIPATALFRHERTSWEGLEATMNLYKCGDALSRPHYLSWAPVGTATPDFHRPEYFARVAFAR